MAIYGVDQFAFPDDSAMAQLFANGFRVTGFYLGPTAGGEHTDSSWMGSRAALSIAGWGFLPTYVGLQTNDANLSSGTGASDANDAIALMQSAGFPQGSFVYLDIESGSVDNTFLEYIDAWISGIGESVYNAGVYCSHDLISEFNGKVDRIWSFDIPSGTSGQTYDPASLPTASIDNAAIATQFRQNVFLTGYGRTEVDLTDSSVSDPSS